MKPQNKESARRKSAQVMTEFEIEDEIIVSNER